MRLFTPGSLFSLALASALPLTAAAQEPTWVQIEAQPSLAKAQERAQSYAGQRQNVNGFALGAGWYAITLGPYAPDDAARLLRELKSRGAIPADSYLTDSGLYRSRFWPLGAAQEPGPLRPLPGAAPAESAPESAPILETETAPAAEAPASDTAPDATAADAPPPLRDAGESAEEARASEKALSRDEKRYLQTALKWAGFYDGAIDGLYGRGTRNSMGAWQAANRYPETGVLTTSQRAEIIQAYEAILEGMDLQLVQDDASGIRMKLPVGVVGFDRYEPPFVRYEPLGDLDAQALLISQQGGGEELAGLYEIMQTLEIVPPEGPRTLNRDGFVLEGMDGAVHSFTKVSLRDGQIKGYSLIWPAGDEQRRSRVLDEMDASFERVDGVLDPNIVPPSEDQAADLVSGLAVRKPRLARTGIFIDDAGSVLTVADAVTQCSGVEIDGGIAASVAHVDSALNLAVLTPDEPLSPRAHAAFSDGVPRLQAKVALAGFPYGGVLTTAAMTFGTLADLRGLAGEEQFDRLDLEATASEAGGPVFDNTGRVIGMLVPTPTPDGKQLPADVAYTLDSAAILDALGTAGIGAQTSADQAYVTDELLTEAAAKLTVLVKCWE